MSQNPGVPFVANLLPGLTLMPQAPMLTPTIPARPLHNAQIGGLLFWGGVIEPNANWPRRLLHHLQTLKPDLHPHMGFPTDWQQRPIWQIKEVTA